MPKLSMSRRHQRQSNLASCWNSTNTTVTTAATSSTTTTNATTTDPGNDRHMNHQVRPTPPRLVSDEDMHQSSRFERSSTTTSTGSCDSNDRSSFSTTIYSSVSSLSSQSQPQLPQLLVLRPDPSATGPVQSARPSPQRPPLDYHWCCPISPATATHSPSVYPPSQMSCTASPSSPWGHFVDHEEEDVEDSHIAADTAAAAAAAATTTDGNHDDHHIKMDGEWDCDCDLALYNLHRNHRGALTTCFLPNYHHPSPAAPPLYYYNHYRSSSRSRSSVTVPYDAQEWIRKRQRLRGSYGEQQQRENSNATPFLLSKQNISRSAPPPPSCNNHLFTELILDLPASPPPPHPHRSPQKTTPAFYLRKRQTSPFSLSSLESAMIHQFDQFNI